MKLALMLLIAAGLSMGPAMAAPKAEKEKRSWVDQWSCDFDDLPGWLDWLKKLGIR